MEEMFKNSLKNIVFEFSGLILEEKRGSGVRMVKWGGGGEVFLPFKNKQ